MSKLCLAFGTIAIFVASVYGTNETTVSAKLNETDSSRNCTDSNKLDLLCIDSDLKNDQSSLLQLLAVTLVSGAWMVYLTFFNSRVVGLIICKLINHFSKDADFHAGSFSFSILSGKLMFRDVSYITKDYSIHINDGYCIFRWWHSYTFLELSKQKELSHGHSRLSFYLFGLEYYVYNQAQVYDKLEKLFDETKAPVVSTDLPMKKGADKENNEIVWWRSLFPVIKFFIAPGKLVFGNRLLPNTLVLSFTEGDVYYKTTEASNCYDLFLHLVEANLKSARLMLVPSFGFDPSVTPLRLNITPDCMEPPPRKMGDGYVVIHSNSVTIKYCWDEPGFVKEDTANINQKLHKVGADQTSGDDPTNFVTLPTTFGADGPLWEFVIQFGKHTTFNYGPWADKQRIILWNFFYPLDYQNLELTKDPKPGDLRISSALKIYAALDNGADFDILFSRSKGIEALQINSGEGSFVEITVPMIVNENGYTTHVSGQLLHPDISTTLLYQNLLKAEMLGFDVKSQYPLVWNGFELWNVDITASKEFFSDLFYDWSYKSHADIMFFVPYTYKFHIQLDSFELYLPVNKHNWVDCQTKPKENAYLALHGNYFRLDFDIPNKTFLPDVCSIPFKFSVTEGQLCAFLPESNMSRNNLLNLAAQQQKWNSETEISDSQVNWDELRKKKWGLVDLDWVIVGEIPSIDLGLTYTWHPIIIPYKAPVRNRLSSFQSSRSTQQSRPKSLTVLHSTLDNKRNDVPKPRGKGAVTFDPTGLSPDILKVDVSVSSGTVLILYGSIIDLVVAFKDNYFGYDDVLTDISSEPNRDTEFRKSSSHTDSILQFRPFEVKVDVNLQNISAVLPIHFTTLYETQPKVTLERLHFELDKNCLQTRLQLILVDLNISVKERATSTPDLLKMSRNCRFQLTNLQLRGHAMFSNAGLPLGSVSVEYAWLTELLIGDIKGLLSVTQMQALLNWLEGFIFLSSNESNQLNKAYPDRKLPTGINWEQKKSDGTVIEETDVKYTMNRVLLRSVHVRLAHERTLFDLTLSPLTVANGNVQDKGVAEAVSVDVQHIQIKHYVLKPFSEEWLEAGEVFMGPILAHVYIASKEKTIKQFQDDFLRFHDKKTRRLFFVWEQRFSDIHLNRTSPMLESVRRMTSWGCAFFAPISPTEVASYPDEIAYLRAPSSQADATDGEPASGRDDFEAGVDYGISLLEPGRVLMPRRTESKEEKLSESTTSSSSSISSLPFNPMDRVPQADDVIKKSPSKHSPSDTNSDEDKLNEKPLSLKSLHDALPPAKLASGQSVGPDLYQEETMDARAEVASTATSDDEFFSAESDLEVDFVKAPSKRVKELPPGFCCNMKDLPENLKQNPAYFSCGTKPAPTVDDTDDVAKPPKKQSLSRPAELALFETPRSLLRESEISDNNRKSKNKKRNNASSGQFPDQASSIYSDVHGFPSSRKNSIKYDVVDEHQPNPVKSGLTYADVDARSSRKTAFETADDLSSEVLFKKTSIDKTQELLSCYGFILTTAKFESNPSWLPKLVTVQNGIHPSVIIDSESRFKSRLKRRSSLDLFRTAQLEDCTSVILHVKGGVNVQVSPFLLDSIHEIVDALTSNATQRHPSSILCHLQANCTRDAIVDYQLSRLNPELIGGVFASAWSQGDGLKTKLKIFMDVVRVNIVQATPGDEEVFNLRQNKMLPTPCLTVAALRLDRLDVSAQLNSKKDKLIKIARNKRISAPDDGDGIEEATISDLRHPFVIFSARAAIHSVACQLRVLSHNGCVPERSNIVALSDVSCRSPFEFNNKVALPRVKEAIKNAGYQRRPPKPWGWVMFEAGINTISAQLLKHDLPMEDSTTSHRHLSEGYLTVETFWINAVTPQSPSQLSRVKKNFRTWNLLTAIAPSCCAWLASVERLISSLSKFNKTATDRYFTTVAASLTLASKSILEKSKGPISKKKRGQKANEQKDEKEKRASLFSELSTAIKTDPSCVLCDFLQLHFRDHENLADLEAALADERNLPTPDSLELGIRVMLAQFVRMESKPVKKQKPKKARSSLAVPSSPAIRRLSDDVIEMTSIKPASSFQTNQADTSFNSPIEQNAENLIVEQQRSGMYNWMQNQTKLSDVESQALLNVKHAGGETMLTESLMREAAETFCNFLTNAGVENVSKDKSNLLQAFCGGSIALHVNVATIRMEKQTPDPFYIRENVRKQKKEKSSFSPRSEVPVIAIHSLAINSSLIDAPLSEDGTDVLPDDGKLRNSSYLVINHSSSVPRVLKNRSTLLVEMDCSIDFVKQRIDIALARLIHQFMTSIDIVQQHLTDVKVTKYTESAMSPDPFVSHRRDFSNISSVIDSPAVPTSFRHSTHIRRRVASERAFHGGRDLPHAEANLSLSEESLAPLPIWQDLYRLIDQHQSELPDAPSYDTMRVETDFKRKISFMDKMPSFVLLKLSSSIKLNKVQLVAEVGDLALSIVLSSLDASLQYTKTGVSLFRSEVDMSLRASLNEAVADLSDNAMRTKKTILTSSVGTCSCSTSTFHPDHHHHNKCDVKVGKISVDLPQRPSSIHDAVARSTKRLSFHMHEFASTPSYKPSLDALSTFNSMAPSATNILHATPLTPHIINTTFVDGSTSTSVDGSSSIPFVIKIDLVVEGIEFAANLLPSSIIRYSAEEITGSGDLSPKGSFDVRLLKHAVHLKSSISSENDGNTTTVISLPQIIAEGEMKDHRISTSTDVCELHMKEGEYLFVSVKVGSFEQTLNTDIVNQLIFLEEVVIHELGDILSKMTKEVSATMTSETSLKTAASSNQPDENLLFQLQLHLEGIQITAGTPSKNAVRLKTGTITFELSNRVLRADQKQREKMPKYMKMFGKAQVELNLGLGTLIYNSVYPEVEPEFQQLAYFKTRIGFQNTTQSQENPTQLSVDKAAEDNNILIHVMRPIFFVQPTAFDKAILFFLVYKNAYDDWTEKREALEGSNVTIRSATQMLTALHGQHSTFEGNFGATSGSSLSLQLSVDDLGICLPVFKGNKYNVIDRDELSSALVLTINNSKINLYYARSLVLAGQFNDFCLRFTDDFQTSWDDWAPKAPLVNSFVVPDGTYQICTDTTRHQGVQMGAKTTANVVWKMKGIDVNLDTNIGYYLTRVVDTMTLITGNNVLPSNSSLSDKLNESESLPDVDSVFHDDVVDGRRKKRSKKVHKSARNEKALKERSKKLEQEYHEQVRLISDLRALGAKPQLLDEQELHLHDLEVQLSSIFRMTFKDRLRRTSLKPSLSEQPPRPTHHRSISAGIARAFPPVPPVSAPYATLPPPAAASSKTSRKQRKTLSKSLIETSSEDFSDNDQIFESKDDPIPAINFTQFDHSGCTTMRQTAMQTESADLELILDVRVAIDGGKIVCQPQKNDLPAHHTSSFGSSRFTKTRDYESNKTVFYVPAVTVKCRYNSVGLDLSHHSPSFPVLDDNSVIASQIDVQTPRGSKFPSRKQSSIYISFALESLPETIISPCFLDFLEQTLQTIPIQTEDAPHSEEDIVGAVDTLDSTIASLPMDAVVYFSIQPSQVLFNCLPMSRVECLLRIPSLDACFSNIRKSKDNIKETSDFTFPEETDRESKTFETKAFSAFPSGLAVTVVMADFSIYVFHPYGTQVAPGAEQKIGSGRKDSLSVDLEVVRINFVRSKKGSANVDASFLIKDKATAINMSVLVDIGTACFKYDMRRINEILAIPRAWYRRSIARQLFFGDAAEENLSNSDLDLSESPSTPRRTPPEKAPSATSSREEWVSVVVYGLKMSRLDVQMNMSNVMGNTILSCDDLHSQGKLAAQSNGDQDLFLSCSLRKSELTAKGGIIGGRIELRELYANCRVLEPINSEPRHKLNVKVRSLDGRIEYMGGCVMMGKLTRVELKMSDEWKAPKPSVISSVEKSSVFVPIDFAWEKFSLAISRSTTPDVIKMLSKLEEFFTQQFQNSVLALTSLTDSRRIGDLQWPTALSSSTNPVYAFHRHWPALYSKIRSLDVSPNFLLGGSFCLRGSHLTIACFHGNNFRSKTWILFNILEPNIMFSTEVQEIKESMTRDESSTFSLQSLTFNLGNDYWLKTATTSSDPMGTVSQVTRSRNDNPPSNSASIDEWFAYITASHTQELTMLRTLNDIRTDGSRSVNPQSESSSSSYPPTSYTHDTDIIFALPKLQLDFKTEHMQGPHEPDPEGPVKPVVDCRFVTEFTDHICVTMNIELIMCLHDLISSYLKEKQQALSSRASPDHVTPVDPIDVREFVCNTWQLEPTIRLISWAGRKIEPVGVDFILQKLGFRHARTTIPKWCQRGVLDVLDHTLAVVLQNLLVAMHQRKRI